MTNFGCSHLTLYRVITFKVVLQVLHALSVSDDFFVTRKYGMTVVSILSYYWSKSGAIWQLEGTYCNSYDPSYLGHNLSTSFSQRDLCPGAKREKISAWVPSFPLNPPSEILSAKQFVGLACCTLCGCCVFIENSSWFSKTHLISFTVMFALYTSIDSGPTHDASMYNSSSFPWARRSSTMSTDMMILYPWRWGHPVKFRESFW